MVELKCFSYVFLLLLVVWFLLIFPDLSSKVFALDYYVDNQATGSNNGSFWTNAWQSFSVISWAAINPGDTIYLSGGTSGKISTSPLTIYNDLGR